MIELASVNLIVRDIKAVEQFYVEMLGLTVDLERTNRPSFVLLRAGKTILTLQDADKMGQNADAGNAVELGFEVADVKAVQDKLGDRAVLQQMGWGNAIETTDPNGTKLNIFEWR